MMKDDEKSRAELLRDVTALRRRIHELEALRENHKKTEEALRESEERFRFMAETTGDVLYRLRYASMKYDYMSPSITKLTGYSPGEIDLIGFSNLIIDENYDGAEKLRLTS